MTAMNRAVAHTITASHCLRFLIEAKAQYPNDLNDEKYLRLHGELVAALEESLAHSEVSVLREIYERPHAENTSPPECLGLVLAGAVLVSLGKSEPNLDDLSIETVQKSVQVAVDASSEKLRALVQECEETMAFECKIPHANRREFTELGRFLFLLSNYWSAYLAILTQFGRHSLCYSPHPLLRYIVQLQTRIRACIARVADDVTRAAVEEVLAIEFEVDTLDCWEEYAVPAIRRAAYAIEKAKAEASAGNYALTSQEKLFINVTSVATERVDRMLANAWRKMMGRQGPGAASAPSGESEVGPPTCAGYVRNTEHALRRIVREVLARRFGDHWLVEVRRVIGEESYQRAVDTMNQRRVNDMAEFLHFTMLKDVYDVISHEWNVFSGSFTMKRSEFNEKMQTVMRGRTEEAHNRPEHLWPEIEQQRVRVACHDILKSIKQAT